MGANISQYVVDAYAEALRIMPFDVLDFLYPYRGSYRQRLDRVRTNWAGQPISRRDVVRHNLFRLGPTRLDPLRLR